MERRPICLVCIGLMLAIWISRAAGIPIFGEPVLSREDRASLEIGISAGVTGTVSSRQIRETTTQYILKDVSVSFGNRQIRFSKLLLFAARAASVSSSFQDSLKDSENENRIKTMEAAAGSETLLRIGSVCRFRASCSLTETPGNPGQFDSRQYYACRKIWVQAYLPAGDPAEVIQQGGGVGETLTALREHLRDRLEGMVSPESAGILGAMLLGDRSMLDDQTRKSFQAASVYHVISISGLHMMALGMAVYRLLMSLMLAGWERSADDSRKSKQWMAAAAAAGAGGAAALFCAFAGSPVSALRACLMFAVYLGAKAARRSYDSLCALSLAGILLLASNPGYLFYSGFQLSAGAVISAAVIFPRLNGLLPLRFWMEGTRKKQILERLIRMVFMWAAITIGLLPLTAWYYYEVPLLGLPANLCVLPLLGPLMGLGLAGLSAGCLLPAAGRIILLPADLILRLFAEMTAVIRHIPGNTWICGKPAPAQILLYYGALGTACFLLKTAERRTKESVWLKGRQTRNADGESKRMADAKRQAPGICRERGASAAIILLALAALFFRIPDRCSLTMLDVGQGDGLVITCSSGSPFAKETVFLSDGGSSDVTQAGEYRILPYLKCRGICRIEGIFISHPDEDHVSGIRELLDMAAESSLDLSIGYLYIPFWMEEDPASEELLAAAQNAGIPVVSLKQGDQITVRTGNGRKHGKRLPACQIRVLHPLASGGVCEGNAGSLVLQLEYGAFSALLTGDLEGQGEKELLPFLNDISCLKTAHHGSRFSSDKAFLDRTRPETALISAGRNNYFGHPHRELLERLDDAGADVYRTDRDGAITLTVEDGAYTIRTFRGSRH